MEFSYDGKQFDTHKSVQIKYFDDTAIEDFTNRLIDLDTVERSLPETIGFVCLQFPFISNLSIIENIMLPLEYQKNLKTYRAFNMVKRYIETFEIEEILYKRKETVHGSGLLRAMFIRAVALSPEVVFFVSPHHFVPLREFGNMLPLFRSVLEEETKMWIALGEGLQLTWEHDVEVSLEV